MTGFCPFSPEDRVAFAYDELPAERQQAFADHLAECRTCALEVAELQEAASLCQTLRSAELPEPRFDADQAPVPARPFWRRPLMFWTPVAAAVAAAVLLFILLSPAPEVPAPLPASVPDQPAVTTLPVQVASLEGVARLRPADGGKEVAFAASTALHPGDVLDTGKQAKLRLELEDGSQLELEPDSRLALASVGRAGDRFSLDHGSLHCRVTPRSAQRPFLVSAPEASVRVVGTRFSVTRKAGVGVEVRVQEGVVAVTPMKGGAEPILLRARDAGLVSPDGVVELSADVVPDEPADQADPNRPANPSVSVAKVQPRADETDRPKPAPSPHKPSVSEPKPPASDLHRRRSHAPESLEALVARLHEDTAWIFDQFRADMKAGRYSDVLRKLDNYLSDPDSPMRDEATFLKAVCLEKLDRKPQALRNYRSYLERWPTGKRAPDSRASIRRIWSSM